MTLSVPEDAAACLKNASLKLERKAAEGSVRLVSPGKIVGILVHEYLDDDFIKKLESELFGE